jgi:hypothetical protein
MLITITGVTSGNSPYNIYVCDSNNVACFYVTGVTTIPPSIIIDTDNFFPNAPAVNLKIIDGSMCEKIFLMDCGGYIYQNDVIVIFMDGNNYVFQ